MAGPNHTHATGCGCSQEVIDGVQDYLYSRIDRDRVEALNATGEGKECIKSWDERMDETSFVESDEDEQLILRIPFTGSIKLRSILIKSGPAGHTPSKVKIFVNSLPDFEEASTSTSVTQEVEITQSREFVEYALRPSRFAATKEVTLFFPENYGEERTRIYSIGFRGEYTAFTRDPIITVYEVVANPADHNKITGMDGAHSQIG